jgi:methylisocitrate lyase
MTTWLDRTRNAESAPARLRRLLARGGATAVPGAHDGLSALMARQAGFEALYLSGAALSASMALPDLGLITLDDVARKAREIVRAADLPLIVDCDTGFGEALNVMQAVRTLEDVGVACVQIEDQQFPKKCGHLNDKRLVATDDMCRKVAAAKAAAHDLLVCARTDAAAHSLDDAIVRAQRYREAGADVIFVEALTSQDDIRRVRAEISAPLLANMTEFGRTPQLALSEWSALGFELVIFPVSSLRVTAAATQRLYETLRKDGHAQAMLPHMMTR